MSLGKQEKGQDNLLLGDYVAVQDSGADEGSTNTASPPGVLLQYEAFFRRILIQRGRLSGTRNKRDSVINVGNRNGQVVQNTTPRSKAG